MKTTIKIASALLFCTTVISPISWAAIDSDASVVELKTSCLVNGNTLDNCFTDLNTLNSWIWSTRHPSPSSPLKVAIAPGTYTGQFSCSGSGFVTLSGSGIQNTIIQNGMNPITTTQCVNMVFSDLTLKNTANLFGVHNIGGSTTWNNVEIIGLGYAWYDQPGGTCGARGSHYWFNSKITSAKTAAGSNTAYFNACDESWFFGSEIKSLGTSGSSTPVVAVGGEVHVYGSVIRALPETGAIMTNVTAVTANNTAEIHIHGTGIDVISPEANDITALKVSAGGSIHASETSYVLKTAAGSSVTRISNNGGTVIAPNMWQQGATPPAINSENGADTMVITNTSDGHPHFAIYDDACASGWYDSSINSCL